MDHNAPDRSHSTLSAEHHVLTLTCLSVYKPGKVAVVLSGRQAGKKVVVIKQVDEGTKERPYPHAIVAGIEKSVGRLIQIGLGLTIHTLP